MAGESGHPATATAQGTRPAEDAFEFSVATATATARHRQMALIVIIATIAAYVVIAANATIQLPQVNSFIPTIYAVIFVTDLVTAVLLYAQFSAIRSRALLLLASGYFFSSLIVVGHLLTFPGAFSPTGLLGAGPQTSSWLNVMWRLGLGASIAGYALLRRRKPVDNVIEPAPRSAMSWSVTTVIVVVCAMVYAAIAGHALLPPLLSDGRILLLGRHANGVIALTNILALLMLLATTRGRSVLDLWLVVAAFGLLADSTMVTFFIVERFSLGFYALRAISVPVSKVVLIVLLWETMRLYANLAIANRELRRERASRLTNAGTLMGAIAHEVRQPLTGINLLAYAGQQSLGQTAPDVGAGRKMFGEIRDAAGRAIEVFDNFLRLVRGGRRDLQSVNMNGLTLEAISLLQKDLDAHNVSVVTELAPDPPFVEGHAGQLREVMLNLIQNAVDAMASVADNSRVITITTSRPGAGVNSISVHDTGPGIDPRNLPSIFDPFVTTKESGTGLGLAICKMIVDQHGGELSAASGGDGGARFTVTLPTGAA